jgi:hypothetical protein
MSIGAMGGFLCVFVLASAGETMSAVSPLFCAGQSPAGLLGVPVTWPFIHS